MELKETKKYLAGYLICLPGNASQAGGRRGCELRKRTEIVLYLGTFTPDTSSQPDTTILSRLLYTLNLTIILSSLCFTSHSNCST